MRLTRVLVFAALLAVPLVFAGSASALDICAEPVCQPPPAEQGTPYTFEFEGEEGCVPYRYSFLNGNLPPGLVITLDGKLTGTPTQAGQFTFWVALDDNSGPDNPFCMSPSVQSQGEFFLTVMPDLAVTTESLPIAVPGVPYRAQLQFSNPEAGWPVIWDVTQGTLPQGITLSADGVLSGTPTGPDLKQFTVRAREPFRRFGERTLTLTVASALQATPAVRVGEVGLPYTGAIRATGGVAPLTWALETGTLPAGLALNPATGALAGIPRAAGSFPLTFAVTDAAGQKASVPASLRIVARLAIATKQLRRAVVGRAFAARLRTTGGLGAKRWSIVRGSLPRGVRFDKRTGRLRGVPRRVGRHRITFQATDRLGARSRKTLLIRVTG